MSISYINTYIYIYIHIYIHIYIYIDFSRIGLLSPKQKNGRIKTKLFMHTASVKAVLFFIYSVG